MQARTKRLLGQCQNCGGSLEFPAENIGQMAPCPRCGQQTELMLATPPEEPMIPRKVIAWTAVTVGLLVAGLLVILAELKRFERRAAERRQKSAVPAQINTNAPPQAAPKSGKP
jgi:uncharacterized paraquat-inducible protein A